MADEQDDRALEARLRSYLAAELRRAEDDFPRLDLEPSEGRRPRRSVGVAFAGAVAVVAVLVAGILALPRLVGPGIGGPPVILMGEDGLPVSIDGESVERLGDMILRDRDRDYLVGGTLEVRDGACLVGSARGTLECGESWALVAGPVGGPAIVATLDGATTAPGFVRTSGALTVIRVGAPSPIDGVLAVTSIAWRQPTKGPIPDDATPPEGGPTIDALVPDFVPMWGPDGVTIAGYIPKRYLLDGPDTEPGGTPSDPPQAEPIPVYGEDLVTLVGHSVPGVGFVALGSTETPSPRPVSEAPATEAPVSVAPSGDPVATAPLPATPNPGAPGPALDCGRTAPAACARAVDLALSVDQGEVVNPSRVVVDDTCPPGSACDRLYPFDSYVVFVTAGADTTGWITFGVTGLEHNLPTAASRFQGNLPAWMANRVAGSSASTFVLRFDVMNRASKPVIVTAAADTVGTRLGFLPGEQGTVYLELGSPSTTVEVQVRDHPSCTPFAFVSYSLGYGDMLLVDDDAAGMGLTLSFDPGLFVAPAPLPVNDLRCQGG